MEGTTGDFIVASLVSEAIAANDGDGGCIGVAVLEIIEGDDGASPLLGSIVFCKLSLHSRSVNWREQCRWDGRVVPGISICVR